MFGGHGKEKFCATTPPPTESRRLLETTENFCYPPPPLNRVDMAFHTKGAPSLGKSWICDCNILTRRKPLSLQYSKIASIGMKMRAMPTIPQPTFSAQSGYSLPAYVAGVYFTIEYPRMNCKGINNTVYPTCFICKYFRGFEILFVIRFSTINETVK